MTLGAVLWQFRCVSDDFVNTASQSLDGSCLLDSFAVIEHQAEKEKKWVNEIELLLGVKLVTIFHKTYKGSTKEEIKKFIFLY